MTFSRKLCIIVVRVTYRYPIPDTKSVTAYLREERTINRLSDKIIELLLYARKVTETNNRAFGLKERLLFCLLDGPLPPRELLDSLCMVKSNLALLAAKCIEEGLIVKSKRAGDGRALFYSLTEKGRATVTALLDDIEKKFDTVLTTSSGRVTANATLESAVELLSFLP